MENTYDIKSEDQLYLVTHVETKQVFERNGELTFIELNNAVRDPFNTENRVLPLNTKLLLLNDDDNNSCVSKILSEFAKELDKIQ